MKVYKVLPDLDKPRHIALWHKSLRAMKPPEGIEWDGPGLSERGDLRDHLARALSPVMMGEQAGLYSITRIVQVLGSECDVDSQLFLSAQAVDEARHMELFALYYRRLERKPLSIRRLPSSYLFQSEIMSENPVEWITGSLVSEVLAKLILEEVVARDLDPTLTTMCRAILEDEARHLAFNHVFLADRFRSLFGRDEGDARDTADHLDARLTRVLERVPPIQEALADDSRALGIDGPDLYERLCADSRRRLHRSIGEGRKQAGVAAATPE